MTFPIKTAKIVDYDTLSDVSRHHLDIKIKNYIAQGWSPHAQAYRDDRQYHQGMIKYARPKVAEIKHVYPKSIDNYIDTGWELVDAIYETPTLSSPTIVYIVARYEYVPE